MRLIGITREGLELSRVEEEVKNQLLLLYG